jgi:hypothetical protein
MLQGLRHPNVLPLHCSFVAESALWLVMPYIGGGNVSQLLRTQVRSRSRLQAAPHYSRKAQVAKTRLSQLIWDLNWACLSCFCETGQPIAQSLCQQDGAACSEMELCWTVC